MYYIFSSLVIRYKLIQMFCIDRKYPAHFLDNFIIIFLSLCLPLAFDYLLSFFCFVLMDIFRKHVFLLG